MNLKITERIVLLGPCPPPDDGTSVPFKLLVEYLEKNAKAEIEVVNVAARHNAGKRSSFIRDIVFLLRISAVTIGELSKGGTLFIYGSRRFISAVGALYSLVYSGVFKGKTVIYIAGGYFDEYLRVKNRLMRKAIIACLKRAAAVGVQTKAVFGNLREMLQNSVYVPNWIDVSALPVNMEPQGNNDLSELSSKDKRTVRLLFIGEVIPEKGIIDLLSAYNEAREILKGDNVALTLDIFGPTKDESEAIVLRKIVEASDVIYHGQVRHELLMRLLQRFDALVLPTRFPTEGYPGVILEAMAMRMPVIATRQRGILELIEDGFNGLLCGAGNVEELKQAILKLAMDMELVRKMGKRAREKAEKFDINIVLGQLCKSFGLEC